MSSDFQELKQTRHRLRDRATQHWHSVVRYHDEDSGTFKLHADESPGSFHLTTTATCFESLETCPSNFIPESTQIDPLDTDPEAFAKAAIERDHGSWKSDGSAHIYCRCRTLPFVFSHLSSDYISEHEEAIQTHVDHIFRQIELAEAHGQSRLSVGEAYVRDRDEFDQSHMDDWYPPNGFHTYWCLRVLDALEEAAGDFYSELDSEFELTHRRNLMIEWAWQELGTQVGLHEAMSSTRDSDQLMWTIAIIATFSDLNTMDLEDQDLLTDALRCLFDSQEEVGTWRHQNPLFHYESSGNAYSHVYEALNAVCKPALDRDFRFLQMELANYQSNFVRLLDYSEATVHTFDDGIVAWSSGHRTNNPKPEGWATANVFAFVQNLRRLFGKWTREAALDQLPTRAHQTTPDAAADRLRNRGKTWCFGTDSTVGDKLETLFLDPLQSIQTDADPDAIPIPEDQARSAILFGPPGTSKTSMIRAIAEALEWDYVEVHSSHFVADGLNNVQKRANEIFEQVGELDRCVVLFDEIDELVRSREEADVYGRFLTTSMLPRIGELWENRRILYFVATNHIEYFDQAIVRGERFDAALFVPPPAFEKKISKVQELLSKDGIDVEQIDIDKSDVMSQFEKLLVRTQEEIDNSDHEANASTHEGGIDETDLDMSECRLAPFAIMRWDELPELVVRLQAVSDDLASGFGEEELGEALSEMKNQRFTTVRGYKPFVRRDRERLDYRMKGATEFT